MRSLAMAHEVPPAEEILERVRHQLAEIDIVNPYEVLVGIYLRPNKTKGGLYLSDKYRDEDYWQGKVGLVLKTGSLAFTADDEHKWPERVPRVGDWVAYRVGDSWQLLVGDQHCRMLQDSNCRLILSSPDLVY